MIMKMNINKELDELLNDPMFEVSNTEETLFELTEAMKRAKEERKAAQPGRSGPAGEDPGTAGTQRSRRDGHHKSGLY